jgi:hypothetical protein
MTVKRIPLQKVFIPLLGVTLYHYCVHSPVGGYPVPLLCSFPCWGLPCTITVFIPLLGVTLYHYCVHSPVVLQVNIMSFIAELLGWFEVHKPDFVKPLLPLDLTGRGGVCVCVCVCEREWKEREGLDCCITCLGGLMVDNMNRFLCVPDASGLLESSPVSGYSIR